MRKIVIAAVMAVISTTALAQPGEYMDVTNGKIVAVKPLITRVPVQHNDKVCSTVEQPVLKKSQEGSAAGTIIGAIVGGVVGNQIGNGAGRDIATGVGVMIGAATGNEMSRDQSVEMQQRVQCEYRVRTEYVNKSDGYIVTVRVDGRDVPMMWHQVDQPYVGRQVTVGVTYNLQ